MLIESKKDMIDWLFMVYRLCIRYVIKMSHQRMKAYHYSNVNKDSGKTRATRPAGESFFFAEVQTPTHMSKAI